MTLKASILLVAIAAGFSDQGCPPSPQPPAPDSGDAAPPAPSDAAPPTPPAPDAAPPADAGPATVYDLACLAMKQVGCTEGQKPSCAADMQHGQEGRINDYHPADVKSCASKACVRTASKGAVACP